MENAGTSQEPLQSLQFDHGVGGPDLDNYQAVVRVYREMSEAEQRQLHSALAAAGYNMRLIDAMIARGQQPPGLPLETEALGDPEEPTAGGSGGPAESLNEKHEQEEGGAESSQDMPESTESDNMEMDESARSDAAHSSAPLASCQLDQ